MRTFGYEIAAFRPKQVKNIAIKHILDFLAQF
jgi:hypothetical protein